MSIVIIDGFKMIYIDKKHGEALAGLFALHNGVSDGKFKKPGIIKTCEIVDECLLFELIIYLQ